MYTSLPRGVPRCQHIKVNGTRCDSPALKGKVYCYFHFRNRSNTSSPSLVLSATNGQQPTAALPNDQRRTTHDPSPTNHPSPMSPPPDLFLLEDANSIQCALQWVLRRILEASMDHRQASLLLYGLQIAAANIKRTRFQPSYDDVVRTLPADPPAETAPAGANTPLRECSAAVPAAVAAGEPALSEVEGPAAVAPAPNAGDPAPINVEAPAPARAGRPRDSRQDAGATHTLPAFSLLSADPQPFSIAEGREPTAESSKLPTDHCPPTTASTDSRLLTPDSRNLPTDPCLLTTIAVIPPRSNKPSRRPRSTSLPTDHRPLITARPALSQMFQREVRRHLARLNFPASPDPDPET